MGDAMPRRSDRVVRLGLSPAPYGRWSKLETRLTRYYDLAPDPSLPFVPGGAGVPTGDSIDVQVLAALLFEHP